MSALSEATQPDTFRSGRYLDTTLRAAASGRVAQRKLNDPASLEFFREIGQRVVEARDRKGWGTEELAIAMGLKYPRMKQIERGVISMHQITQLAEVLDVEPRWLLHGTLDLHREIGVLVETQLALERDVRALLAAEHSSSTGS